MDKFIKIKTKLTTLFSLLSFVSMSLFSQETFKMDNKAATFIDNSLVECIYNYTVKAEPNPAASLNSGLVIKNDVGQTEEYGKAEAKPDENGKIIQLYYTILQTNGTTSKFWDWHSFKKDSILYHSSTEISADSVNKLDWEYNLKVEKLFYPVIFKNFPEGKLTVTDEIMPNDYIYEEPKSDFDWKLGNDTLTICGYLCYQARTELSGLKWTVWYTSEIALSDGPWKFYGLPGLILKAENSDDTHTFEAISIRNSDRPIYIDKNAQLLETIKKTFIKNKNAFEIDPLKNLPANQISSISVLKNENLMIINGKPMKAKRPAMYMPLELVEK